MKRLKLTFSKTVYKELLDEIRQANKDLRECTHQSIALEPMKRRHRSRRPIAELKIVRKHAASLYKVVMNNKAWQCDCKTSHLASLRLEARPRELGKVNADGQEGHAFRILLSVAAESIHPNTSAQWDDIEIIPTFGGSASVEKIENNSDLER